VCPCIQIIILIIIINIKLKLYNTNIFICTLQTIRSKLISQLKKAVIKKLYINKSIKSCLKKVCFKSLFKRCEGLSVSDLCQKTVPQFRHRALADTNRVTFLDLRLYLDWGATAIRSTRYCGTSS